MSEFKFECPNCSSNICLEIYSLGMADGLELRCDRCARTLLLSVYSKYLDFFYASYGGHICDEFKRNLENRLEPCSCGGVFRVDAPYRCPRCEAEIPLEEIKRQIRWWGSKDGRPGVVLNGLVDERLSEKKIWKSDLSDKQRKP